MNIAQSKYASQPKPGITIARMRTIIGSILKYSPIPPHTPAIQRFLRDLYKRFVSICILHFNVL